MADVVAEQRKGWCELDSCEWSGGQPTDVVVFSRGVETKIEVCDSCLIQLSSGRSPEEFEEMEEKIDAQRKRIDEHEAQVERMIAAANQDLVNARKESN